ncbi:phosphatidylinositol 3-kinase regulatory subunit alpha-like [Electrophorus electricus]|uniref:phosphatidylinositol 3-kinase regulatory subunit alpha-like n=1 Tax=Electrophorus electricus TaxID=8005 RepID=UPI0015D06A16|nr:phosphatidylinositol 3-kinase regulatory subunit alpha-like [Electrophorus electricus]
MAEVGGWRRKEAAGQSLIDELKESVSRGKGEAGIDKRTQRNSNHVWIKPCRKKRSIWARDPAAVDCEQYALTVLADTLRAYLQDLLCPLIPEVVYSELVYTAQETQNLEECGQQLKKILDSPSVPQSNHQLLVHLTRHLSKVAQSEGAAQASPRLLGQAYSEAVFKNNHFSADVNPEHHVKILEALISVGGLMEMQAAPGTQCCALKRLAASLPRCLATSRSRFGL